MAKYELKNRAIKLRLKGMSYSQIKQHVPVSKSTLSVWLTSYPLSADRINELKKPDERRIEKYRETRRRKREDRLVQVYKKVARDIGKLSQRELLLAGLFLYWGEGGKTRPVTTCLSNSDPALVQFFITWLGSFGIPKEKLKIHLHLYRDMVVEEEIEFWSKKLGLPTTSFTKPYIKSSYRSGLTYTQKFTHGTCNIIYHNRDISEYILSSIAYIQRKFAAE